MRMAAQPDVALTIYGGPEFAPGVPNQREHVEFAAAVVAAYDSLTDPPRWLFSIGPAGTHIEMVDGFIDIAVESFAAHEKYVSTLESRAEAARMFAEGGVEPMASGGCR